MALGATVQPLDKDGKPSTAGKIVLISIGISNASRNSRGSSGCRPDARKNPDLLLIDAARNGADATLIAEPCGDYWSYVGRQLQRGDVTDAQVQVVWLKTALAHVPSAFPEKARFLQEQLRSIVEILGTNFPRLKLIYVSSRIYAGYRSDLVRNLSRMNPPSPSSGSSRSESITRAPTGCCPGLHGVPTYGRMG